MKKFLTALLFYVLFFATPVLANSTAIPAMQYYWTKQKLNVYVEDSKYKDIAKNAFKDWDKSKFDFVFVEDSSNSDINIYIIKKEFDKKQNIAANCELYRVKNNILHANIYVPEDENKKIFEMVTAHEIGHALGIVQHTEDNLMSKKAITKKSKVTKSDISKIEKNSYVIEENKRDLSAYADACKQAKDYDKAIKLYKQILDESPDFVPAIYSTGFCYYSKGDIQKASEYIKKAFLLEPNNPYYMNGYVKILLKLDDKKSAENVFDSFLKKNPTLKNHFAVKQSEKLLKR